jgi:predicted transcriptional regulator of viral defense system
MSTSMEKAVDVFRKHGGILLTSHALKDGIHPRTLYEMRDEGLVERLCRGTYRLSELPPLSNPDLVTISIKIPKGVICLLSALSYHGMTTEIPHEVYVATHRDMTYPRLDYPPVRVFRFSGKAFREGVETHKIDEREVQIYNPEKTIADCFKFRNQIGREVPIEALKLYWLRRKPDVKKLLYYASICRVSNIIRPYLEVLT